MLVVLAVVFTPPDKIPELSRKAARLIHFLRGIANNAQDQLRQELGPEFADLDLRDLHPKTFVQKHLLNDLQDDIDAIKGDLNDIKSELNDDINEVKSIGEQLRDGVRTAQEAEAPAPFDTEAT